MQLTKHGPNTITNKKALRKELGRIRDEGHAVNDEELAPGLLSIAVPVRCESGEIRAALNLAAHNSMISLAELVENLAPHLITAADQISAFLGYRRADEQAGSR
jgi:IclR family transcriptional regulator, pca regulon regulatory protein